MEQRSDSWFAARVGKVTASRIADVVAKTRSGWGASRANYMGELIAERLTGSPASRYTNAAMQHGIDTEPEAIAALEFYADVTVQPVGFVDHPTIAMSGASPDGLIGEDGLCEVKCPQTSTHLDTLLGASIPNKYLLQMQWQLACTGRQWCKFASYDPRLPEEMKIHITHVQRDYKLFAELETQVLQFLQELDSKVQELTRIYLSEKAA